MMCSLSAGVAAATAVTRWAAVVVAAAVSTAPKLSRSLIRRHITEESHSTGPVIRAISKMALAQTATSRRCLAETLLAALLGPVVREEQERRATLAETAVPVDRRWVGLVAVVVVLVVMAALGLLVLPRLVTHYMLVVPTELTPQDNLETVVLVVAA